MQITVDLTIDNELFRASQKVMLSRERYGAMKIAAQFCLDKIFKDVDAARTGFQLKTATQLRRDSFLEALTNTAIGYIVAVLANFAILPLFGYHPSFTDSNLIALLFTLVSVVRSYVLRRLFNGRSPYSWIKQRIS